MGFFGSSSDLRSPRQLYCPRAKVGEEAHSVMVLLGAAAEDSGGT